MLAGELQGLELSLKQMELRAELTTCLPIVACIHVAHCCNSLMAETLLHLPSFPAWR